MGHEDRMKASDVFRQSRLVFITKAPFDEAFPEIEQVVAEVEFTGPGTGYKPLCRVYRKESIGEYVDCLNPLCYSGGFSIGKILCEMVRERKTDLEASEMCQGYEGSPKGRRRYRDCLSTFHVRVHIDYKAPSQSPT